MKRNTRFFLPLWYAALIIIGMFIGAKLTPVNRMFSGAMSASIYNYNKIQDILYLIERDYVDPVDQQKLVDLAIAGMLERLDPHSVYLTQEQLKAANEEIEGNFEGVGVQFSIRRDTVIVVQVIKGGPSEKAGVLAGDRIIAVNNQVIAGNGITNEEVMKLLKGPKGSKAEVKIFRPLASEILDYSLERDVIQTVSIDAAYMLNTRTGYIRMHTFAGNTYHEFMGSMNRLTSEGMKNLVLDLRGNGGGLLDQAISIANEFLGSRELIVYTMGKSGKKKTSYANGKGAFPALGLVILIDDFSASASEIIAGAIQDHDRGMIVGRRSFGKGLVQQQVLLADGSAIRMTTERYYTPSGRSIQKPYSPDDQDAYYGELLDRYNPDGSLIPDTAPHPDSLKFKTLKKGRTVLGGGGITPDHFIPMHQKHDSEWFRLLTNSGLLFEFAADYADRNRSAITDKYDTDGYISGYSPGGAVVRQLIAEAAGKGIKVPAGQPIPEARIAALLKAQVGRILYGEETFFRIINQQDEAVKKAVSILRK